MPTRNNKNEAADINIKQIGELGEKNKKRLLNEHKKIEEKIEEIKEETGEEKKGEKIIIREDVYWQTRKAYIYTWPALFFVSFFLFVLGSNVYFPGTLFLLQNIGLIGLAWAITHPAFSFGELKVDEIGGLTFFGMPVRLLKDPGLVWRPLWIFKLIRESITIQQENFPGEPEKIKRIKRDAQGLQAEIYEEGEVRPIFITSGHPTYEDIMILKKIEQQGHVEETSVLYRQFTVDVTFFIWWRVVDLFTYERRIKGSTPKQRRKEIVSMLASLATAEIKATIGQLTPAEVILLWEEIGKRVALRLQKVTLSWGIEIERFGLREQNLSHDTHAKQADSIRAAFEKIAVMRRAEAEEYKRTKEGEGAAVAKRRMLENRGEGLKKIAGELEIEEMVVVLAYETAQEIAEKAKHVVYGGEGGVTDLLRSVTAATNIPDLGKK